MFEFLLTFDMSWWLGNCGCLLLLSHFGTCMCSNVETNLSWTCLVSGLLNFENPSVLLFCFCQLCVIISILLKAILQVLIYKALYDKSYLGYKTTMTSGEWTCLISFATAPLTCSEGRERKIQNENICLQRDSNPRPASPRQESCSALDRSATKAWWWSVVKCLAG